MGKQKKDAAFQRFLCRTLEPVMYTGPHKIDVMQCGGFSPVLLRAIDNLENDWLSYLEEQPRQKDCRRAAFDEFMRKERGKAR